MERQTCTFKTSFCLASRISHTWVYVMHANGWRDYCDANPEFNYISYGFTNDTPQEVIDYGEKLWAELLENFGGEDSLGEVFVSKGSLNCITRRRELWDK